MSKPINIMVVDDDPDIIFILKTLLKREGYKIVEASGGADCIKKLKKKIDLVLLDLMMPDMDGWETCRRIKENPDTKSIPVSILSVKGDDADLKKSREYAHADGHLVKPINYRELLKTIGALTARNSAASA